jgi:hypothetical protein
LVDGDCRFCSLWIKRWQQTTGDRVDYLPFQDASVGGRFRKFRAQFEKAVQLIERWAMAAAEAALRARAHHPTAGTLRCYERSPRALPNATIASPNTGRYSLR